MSLILGNNKVNRDEVREVETPESTDSYVPIPHSVKRIDNEPPSGLVEMVEAALSDAGFTVQDEDHVLARDGQRYFGGFAVTREDVAGKSRQLVVGIRNSHDRSFAASICIGNRMLVCENLCFSSERVIGRRHTTNVLRDLPNVISKVIASLVSEWQSMEDRIEAYQDVTLTEMEAARLFVTLAEKGAVPKSKVYRAFELWSDPAIAAKSILTLDSFIDENDEADLDAYNQALEAKKVELRKAFGCGQNLWGAYNALTELLKGGNTLELPNRTMIAQSIFDVKAEFVSEVEEEVAVATEQH